MRKALFITIWAFALIFFCSGQARAEGVSIEAFGGLATEPMGDFGATVGGGAGVNIDFLKVVKVKNPKVERVVRNIKFRADLSHYWWEDDVGGLDIEYRRTPLFLGGRYHYAASPTLSFFGEAGLEISYDRVDLARGDDDTKTRTGPAIGAGLKFDFTRNVYGSFFMRHHAIKDDYFSALFAAGFYLD